MLKLAEGRFCVCIFLNCENENEKKNGKIILMHEKNSDCVTDDVMVKHGLKSTKRGCSGSLLGLLKVLDLVHCG